MRFFIIKAGTRHNLHASRYQDIHQPLSFFFIVLRRFLSILSAANLPVKIQTGSPEGLNVHCPAWYTSGIGVKTDLLIFCSRVSEGSLLSASARLYTNAGFWDNQKYMYQLLLYQILPN